MNEARERRGSAAMSWTVAQKGKRPDQFRTSLRKEEQDLLNYIDHTGSATGSNCRNRSDLAAILEENKSELEDKEVDYLQKLISSSQVPSEVVASAKASCKFAPSLAGLKELQRLADEDEDYGGKKHLTRVSSVKQKKDTSFRKEVWSASERLLVQKRNSVVQEEENEPKHHHVGEAIEKVQKAVDIFGILFGGGKKNKKKDDEQVAAVEAAAAADESWAYTILGTCPDDEECFPHVLTPPIMEGIRSSFPMAVSNDNFWLKYSMIRDGASIRAFYDKVRNSSRTIIAIETMEGDVFGAFVSSPWAPRGPRYFGTGEAFVWRMEKSRFTHCKSVEDQVELESNIQVFKWSDENRNVQHLQNLDSELIIGGGGPDDGPPPENDRDCGSALVIKPSLERGYSNLCLTFKSPVLPPSGVDENFEIANMEAWTLTPVDDVDQAEKVELGRRFIFEQTNFIET